jgi:hypothetical protein
MDHSAVAAIQAVMGVDALEALDVDVIATCHVQTLVARREMWTVKVIARTELHRRTRRVTAAAVHAGMRALGYVADSNEQALLDAGAGALRSLDGLLDLE